VPLPPEPIRLGWSLSGTFGWGMLSNVDDVTEDPIMSLVGYERHGRFFWNLPVARLSVFAGFVTIDPTTRWLGFVVPPWRAAIGDLIVAEAVRNGVRRGVRLRTRTGDYRIFYCSTAQQAAILDCFLNLRVSVERQVQKVYFLDPRV
jgi:hypothetical protein